ncbi:hypothetical protein F4780DRAFT_726535 [Xylariomycetidae sp. FL0641]|nr:hypothetical protein F4780DRAFT_726535 [Xylariomycetidae sp. FL0641]
MRGAAAPRGVPAQFDLIFDYTQFFCALPPARTAALLLRRRDGRLVCLEFPAEKRPAGRRARTHAAATTTSDGRVQDWISVWSR